MTHIIAPSLLAANFAYMQRDIGMINDSDADWLHIDIMDGMFVPTISFGQLLMPYIHSVSTKPLDVHLMIEQPSRYVNEFVELGAASVTVHIEADRHLHRTLTLIRNSGALAGVALNPHTSVDLLDDILEITDIVLIMSVNPGFGGQKFIYQTLPKIRQLKSKIIERNLKTRIEVDGGVGLQNARSLIEAGADILVAGSSIFGSEEPQQTITRLKTLH